MTFESMNLKVCEGCGSLWVRSIFVPEVYCSRCVQKLAAFPRVGTERRPGRKRKLIAAMQGDAQ
jgi:hypothetical protein